MKKDCIVTKNANGVEYYEFVSKNGISYSLYHGVPACKKGQFVSDKIFITFFPYFEDEELWDDIQCIIGGPEIYVGFIISSKNWEARPDNMKDDEIMIRWLVDAFEEKHPKIVEFMVDHAKGDN